MRVPFFSEKNGGYTLATVNTRSKTALVSLVSSAYRKDCHPERSEGSAFQPFTSDACSKTNAANERLGTLGHFPYRSSRGRQYARRFFQSAPRDIWHAPASQVTASQVTEGARLSNLRMALMSGRSVPGPAGLSFWRSQSSSSASTISLPSGSPTACSGVRPPSVGIFW